MLRIKKTKLPGVLCIRLDCFKDRRGEYVEMYNEKEYKASGIDVRFIQDDYSMSKKHALRGIHGDNKTWKLVMCPLGKFYLVVVNCDKTSDTFGKWEAFIVSEKNKIQVLVPPKHGLAHLALTDRIIFHYKQSTYYNPSIQFTYRWNEPRFNIRWPIKNPILSKRDKLGHYV